MHEFLLKFQADITDQKGNKMKEMFPNPNADVAYFDLNDVPNDFFDKYPFAVYYKQGKVVGFHFYTPKGLSEIVGK